MLDGNIIDQGFNKDIGFIDADRVENLRCNADVDKLMIAYGFIVMTFFISSSRQERENARKLIDEEDYIEVLLDLPLAVCE